MRIIDYDTYFHITWDFNHWHSHNLKSVKAIGYTNPHTGFVQESKYIAKEKLWYVPGKFRQQVERLQKTNRATIILHSALTPEITGELPPMAELTIPIPWKEGTITRPYQDTGIAQGMKFERCLIGDEQGLGKTLQSIGIMIGLQVKPVLVVCPASTKLNWKREFEKFSHYRSMVLDGKMSPSMRKNWHQYVSTGLIDVVIVNYESIRTFLVDSYPQEKTAKGKKKPWHSKDVVLKECMSLFKAGILDESQRCKDPLADQTKFIIRIFHTLKYRLLLSGTPVINKPIDLFPQLAIMGVLKRFGDAAGFKERYCEGGKGASNLKELNYLLNTNCFFRREKKDVAKDLPDKQRQTIICEISNRDEYDKAEADFKRWLEQQGLTEEEVTKKMEGEAILKMMNLKAIAGKGKINEVKEFVNEVIEAGEKLILFCNLHSIVDECLRIWPNAVTVTGRDDTNKRQRNIDAFQNDPKCQLIVCNHKAAGVGITLTASSRVAFIEYPWTYADCVQCEDRAHRIGQKNNVMCTYFLGQNTVDERMWELIIEKMTIGNTVTGATDMMENIEQVDKTFNLFNEA